ncbi:hypothetical protein H0H81_010240 [Sphagnurus paluster]|uniref:F-box domain-containing protein n=1 Tax=Sphagnurus paluster TaxID=117069 RepID=A0A9P7FUW9_9AGAR|nr:hypothetical protein H0H81_010240 [Sphagnurus paluster]
MYPTTLDRIPQVKQTFLHILSQISPISHLFRTNNPPSDLELQQLVPILRHVNTVLCEFDRLDADGSLTAVSEPLEHLHDALQGAISPIRRLPTEILSQIFLECLPCLLICDERTFWNSLNNDEPPWTLTRVSRRWREVALRDQRLWSSLDLDKKGLESLRKLRLCLQRSGNSPLSIDCIYPANARPLLNLLSIHSARWKHIKIRGYLIEHCTRVKGKLPQLETLEIWRWPDVNRCDTFAVAPMLRHIEVWDSLAPIRIPWHQIESLKVHSISGLAGIFASAPQLSQFFLYWFEVAGLNWNRISLAKHSGIKTVYIEEISVLKKLELSSLESLEVADTVSLPVPLSQITHFITRSFCRLQTLILSEVDIHEEPEIRALFDCTQSLVNLTIKDSWRRYKTDWSIVMHILTIAPSQPTSIARLENITFDFKDKAPLNFLLLLEMLESRAGLEIDEANQVCHLKSINLYNLPNPPEGQAFSVVLRLHKLRSLGIRMNLDPVLF